MRVWSKPGMPNDGGYEIQLLAVADCAVSLREILPKGLSVLLAEWQIRQLARAWLEGGINENHWL